MTARLTPEQEVDLRLWCLSTMGGITSRAVEAHKFVTGGESSAQSLRQQIVYAGRAWPAEDWAEALRFVSGSSDA